MRCVRSRDCEVQYFLGITYELGMLGQPSIRVSSMPYERVRVNKHTHTHTDIRKHMHTHMHTRPGAVFCTTCTRFSNAFTGTIMGGNDRKGGAGHSNISVSVGGLRP